MVPVRIENRAQLIYLLTEAAELEHEILCCYLFAIFSMKDDTREGLTPAQLETIRRWRGVIGEIVVQEMIHLATACNLLTAVGGSPQMRRPNLPTGSRAYPPGFELRLVPFGVEALDRFVTLERPEALARTEDYRTRAVPMDRLSDIFSSERHYETVGELYRGIEDGFAYLTQKLGEAELFVGPPAAQIADEFFSLPGLIQVHDLESALAAIEVIVEQGEGATIDVEDSHYRRFLQLREEYAGVLRDAPDFVPGRPVLVNPYALLPNDISDIGAVNLMDDQNSVNLCNLFDGCYELMVQMLGRLFMRAGESKPQLATLGDIAVGLMVEVIQPLGSAITLLPAGPSHPGMNAGPSFRLSRGAAIPGHAEAARRVFNERLTELARYCQFLQMESSAPDVLRSVREALDRHATAIGTG